MSLYLDYNASNPIDPRVLDLMIDIYRNHSGNAHSRTHIYGQKAELIVTEGRKEIADLLGIDSGEVFFTSGATESNNIALQGLARWGKREGKTHIVSTAIEHKAVLEPLFYLEKQGFELSLIPPNVNGRVDADRVIESVTEKTLLISVMHVNNETGVIQPVQEIGEALKHRDVYFHIDAAQSYGKLVEELRQLPYDILSVSGHKIAGPQGIGALIVKRKNYKLPPLEPLFFGGGQEGGIRPGTLPVAMIAGLGKASQLALDEYQQRKEKAYKIKDSFLSAVSSLEYQINGDQKYCLPSTINISFAGVDSEALMLSLHDTMAFSNGSACTAHDYESSHVLTAMGLGEQRAESAVRLSWGGAEGVNWDCFESVVKKFM